MRAAAQGDVETAYHFITHFSRAGLSALKPRDVAGFEGLAGVGGIAAARRASRIGGELVR